MTPSTAIQRTHVKWLMELTGLPTAAGREDRVWRWIESWVRRRPSLYLRRDRFGNGTIGHRGVDSDRPIYFTAHVDHPAFVVRTVADDRTVKAEFRGGVRESFFLGSPVILHDRDARPQRGIVRALGSATVMGKTIEEGARIVTIEFESPVSASPGQVITWDVGAPQVNGDRLHAPACDDLAGVASALAAFDRLKATRRGKATSPPDVRLLLTRAEEVGFLGAIAVCKSRTIPKRARLICLENSKAFAESPLGAGPIVRVGDKISTFNPQLTYAMGEIARGLQQRDPSFKWQRKLMVGGTCEASVFQSYGYTAGCLCLPLANYHNMDEEQGRIAPESISLSDYHALVRLLVAIGRTLDDRSQTPSLRERLDDLYDLRSGILDGD